jgi:hypothetical protein
MKVAVFHPESGMPFSIMHKDSDESVLYDLAMNPLYWGCPARVLDGTVFELTMTLSILPALEEFDEAVGYQSTIDSL